MKKLILMLVALSMVLLTIPAAEAVTPKIVDEAKLLTDSEITELEQQAQQLVDQYEIDVVILTVDSIGYQDSTTYADNYYDQNGYGIGSDFSGVLFLISMEYRDWAISTCGAGIDAVSNYDTYEIVDSISWYLSQDQFYLAFRAYLNELETYFDAYANGSYTDDPDIYYPVVSPDYPDYNDYPGYRDSQQSMVSRVLISLLIGAAAGGIGLLILRGKMNTVVPQKDAQPYLVTGSYGLHQQQDVFLYSHTSRVRRQDTNSSSGGMRSGGGSVHRSSGGRSHGGGRGKF